MKKHWKACLLGLVVVLIAADLGGAYYLFNFAFKKGGYSDRNNDKPLTQGELWAKNQPQETWEQTSKDKQSLKLKARYYPAPKKTNKTMVMVHGYGDNSLRLGPYIKMYHEAGYNVLAPDDRGAGRSEGQYIGYGWADRDDLQSWIQQVLKRNGQNSQIGLFGVSMGASTVMYYLGLDVPKQVQFAVADCGYASIKGELEHELDELFNLPSFPLIPTANLYTQMIAKYNFYDADTKTTLRDNKVPLFIIHGTKDDFVPTENAKINYDNDGGPKKLWLVPGAEHAESYKTQPKQYKQKVLDWSKHYFE